MSMNMDSQIFLYAQRWILYPGCQRLSRGHNTRLLCFFCRRPTSLLAKRAAREPLVPRVWILQFGLSQLISRIFLLEINRWVQNFSFFFSVFFFCKEARFRKGE